MATNCLDYAHFNSNKLCTSTSDRSHQSSNNTVIKGYKPTTSTQDAEHKQELLYKRRIHKDRLDKILNIPAGHCDPNLQAGQSSNIVLYIILLSLQVAQQLGPITYQSCLQLCTVGRLLLIVLLKLLKVKFVIPQGQR